MISILARPINPPTAGQLMWFARKLEQAQRNMRRCSARRFSYWCSIEERLARRQCRARGPWRPGIVCDWETVSLT